MRVQHDGEVGGFLLTKLCDKSVAACQDGVAYHNLL